MPEIDNKAQLIISSFRDLHRDQDGNVFNDHEHNVAVIKNLIRRFTLEEIREQAEKDLYGSGGILTILNQHLGFFIALTRPLMMTRSRQGDSKMD